MNKYLLEIHFRRRDFSKDFEEVEVTADNEQEAHTIAKDLRTWVFQIKTLNINGKKVNHDDAPKA